jgi:dehydrogenase/reductase SDR family member 12
VTVIGSFSSLGIRARRALHGWADPAPDALRGRTVLVTGPTSGLGRAAAEAFAELGARVVLVGRSPERLDALRAALVRRHGEDRFPTVIADLGSLESVRAAVAQVRAAESRLDVLVDNAGAIFPERRESPDGIEATLALMVVGPFALVSGLLPLLRATPGARVIAMSSGGQYTQALRLGELEWRNERFDGTRAYARAKRAQVALIREWARRMEGDGTAFIAMHPGWARTPGLADSLPGFSRVIGPILRTAEEGIDTLLWLATAAEGGTQSGTFVHDRRRRPFDRLPATRLDAAARRELWAKVAVLAGVDEPTANR